MRLTIIFDNFGPYHLARVGAAAQLIDITGLELRARSKTYGWEAPAGSSFRKVTLPAVTGGGRAERKALLPHLHRALEESKPDVLAVNGWGDFMAAQSIRWCVRNNVPFILLSESSALDGPSSALRIAVKRRVIVLASAALVGGSPHREYVIQMGMPPDSVFTGYNVVDNRYFASKVAEMRNAKCEHVPTGAGQVAPANAGPEGRYSRERERQNRNVTEHVTRHSLPVPPPANWQLPTANAPYFLASNRFVERKNLARLVDAYAGYVRSIQHKVLIPSLPLMSPFGLPLAVFPAQPSAPVVSIQGRGDSGGISTSPWNLCLLGDGPLRADLIAQCKAHDLVVAECAPWQQLPTANCQPSTVSSTPTVFFPGFRQIDELPRFYARAGCFIHPALVEPWGLVVNEAMACGLPVLASNRCGCATDLVQDGINGFIFDPSSVEQLTDLMTRVSAFDFPLSAFSAESTRIIGNWTPARFAENLQSAAKHAIECGACRHRGISSRILLNCLCLIR